MIVLLLTSLAAGYSGFTTISEDNTCPDDKLDEVTLNKSFNDSIDFSGVYCARTGGYTVNESIDIEENNVNIEVDIESPDESAITVITPVEFSVTEEDLEDGNYDLQYSINLDSETLKSGEENFRVGEQGFLTRFFNRLGSIFSL